MYDGSLLGAAAPGTRTLTVASGLTGLCSRDAAQQSVGVTSIIVGCAQDDRIHELNGLTFTSAPVAATTTLSGPMSVHLNTVQDATAGFWNVEVNDVAPDGQSTVLSTGQLAASLRAIDESRSTCSADGDYTVPVPALSLDTRRPTVPGQSTPLDIAVPGVQAVLRPGHRLRVDVPAGANLPKGLPPTPLLLESGLLPQHLLLDPAAPSFVNLPVSGEPGW